MKRKICVLACLLLCVILPGGCEAKNSSDTVSASSAAEETTGAASQGNAAAFNMTPEQTGKSLSGMWSNQNDYTEKIRFEEGLSFIHYIKADRHPGSAVLSDSGMLTLRYDDDYQPEKTYIWVDSYKNAGANTWYVDGGKIAIGGVTFIRDKEI